MATAPKFEYAREQQTPPVFVGFYAWATKFSLKVEAGADSAAKIAAKKGAVKLAVEAKLTESISLQVAAKASTKTGLSKAAEAIRKGNLAGLADALNFFEGSLKGKDIFGFPAG
jgi:hypothetical protein